MALTVTQAEDLYREIGERAELTVRGKLVEVGARSLSEDDEVLVGIGTAAAIHATIAVLNEHGHLNF